MNLKNKKKQMSNIFIAVYKNCNCIHNFFHTDKIILKTHYHLYLCTNKLLTPSFLKLLRYWEIRDMCVHFQLFSLQFLCVGVHQWSRFGFINQNVSIFFSFCLSGQSCQTLWKWWATTSFDNIISSSESLLNNQVWPDQSINQISDESPYFAHSFPWSLTFLSFFFFT